MISTEFFYYENVFQIYIFTYGAQYYPVLKVLNQDLILFD